MEQLNNSIETRKCIRCKELLPLDSFNKDPRYKSGLKSTCKPCLSEYQISYRKTDKHKEYLEATREKRREQKKEWQKSRKDEDKDYYKNKSLRTRYGISPEEYNKLFMDQEGKCKICGCEETTVANGITRSLAVDHNHTSGVIRGLLCRKCNTAIGLLKEDKLLLLKAVEYLDNAD